MEAQALNEKYDLFEAVQAELRLAGRLFERGFLLGRAVDGLHLEETRFAGVPMLDCVFRGLRAMKATFDRCDFACTTFIGGYFRRTDFTGCTFRQVVFVDCVFDGCRLPRNDEAAFERCLFFDEDVPKAAPPAVTATPAVPSAPAEEKIEPPIAERFSSLER